MLRIYRSLKEMSFSSLVALYSQSLYEGLGSMDDVNLIEKRLQAEQSFYAYLRDSFFQSPKAFYAVWERCGRYVAGLRMEPYRGGLLLEALETAPDVREKGYATRLLLQTLAYLSNAQKVTVYAHVDKKNLASLRVHEKAGFIIFSNSASFIDGSFSSSYYTLCKD